MQEIDLIIDEAKASMTKALDHLEQELMKIRAGKANPAMLNGIMVEAYGAPTPLSGAATITVPDMRMIAIQPWDKTLIGPIEKAIMQANIGLTPQNDGILIRINIPPLTEERRKELAKQTKSEGEKSKIAIRNIRRDHIEDIKKLKKDGAAEDLVKDGEDKMQKLTDGFIEKVDKYLEIKEKEIMTV
ncbi:MAG: ribosome recycling factor [Bacteroidetes bacterium]|nr:ribosome recycling factor [Bacteroidota bacterium]MBP7477659.1 ribosome recycling factor [Chitinophagales bacterium]